MLRKSLLALALAGAGLLASPSDAAAETYVICCVNTCHPLPGPSMLEVALGATLASTPEGVLVVAITQPAGVAAAMGLQAGDLIRSANGFSIRTTLELFRQVVKAKSDFGGVFILDVRGSDGHSNSVEGQIF